MQAVYPPCHQTHLFSSQCLVTGDHPAPSPSLSSKLAGRLPAPGAHSPSPGYSDVSWAPGSSCVSLVLRLRSGPQDIQPTGASPIRQQLVPRLGMSLPRPSRLPSLCSVQLVLSQRALETPLCPDHSLPFRSPCCPVPLCFVPWKGDPCHCILGSLFTGWARWAR